MSIRFYSWLMVPLALLVTSGEAEDVSGLSTNQVVTNTFNFGPLSTTNKLRKTLLEPDYSLGLQRMFLTDQRVTCNDGSPAGYYIRKTPGSRRWIIFLEGGMYCYDPRSCGRRWARAKGLMSSHQWADVRHAGGILSPNSDENPYWWNANHILVPYCSSDSWSGAQGPSRRRYFYASEPNTPRFNFMGSYIVSQVVSDLLPQGLINGSKLILAGSSAGGTGVLLNIDRIASTLRRVAPRLDVRGLSDSGWFLDRAPFPNNDLDPRCREKGTCRAGPATLALQHALRYWEGRVPEECALQHPTDKWKCFFGQFVYPSIRTPLFIFQWLFDEAQIAADNVGAPTTKQQWDYIHSMGDNLRRSLENVTSFFVPSCISHTVLTSRDWRHVRVSRVSLPEALVCWELQPVHKVANKHYSPMSRHLSRHRHGVLTNTTWPLYMLADAPAKTTRGVARTAVDLTVASGHSKPGAPDNASPRNKNKRRRCKKNNRERDGKQQRQGGKGRRTERRCRNKERNKNSEQRQRASQKNERPGGNRNGQNRNNNRREQRSLLAQCQFRVVERCSWPQCNHSCPKLHNPYTGEELDFIELLKSFGLDMSSMAQALGIDLDTLQNMEHKELLNLLTQQAN
ncbi:palmitoleoyl-protein carboxylesterase notum1' [Neocloeon triangulifer]|uniref:palmitoleoyl-protein carboxylesterase notum1' n=1 Tax=Neocloeon triangulifer TaxID=2078957 RepID=UPI00286F11F1|nr:palmitoleoyl-protein carboxylesterase notum1' [Neocloeon triangulifer]